MQMRATRMSIAVAALFALAAWGPAAGQSTLLPAVPPALPSPGSPINLYAYVPNVLAIQGAADADMALDDLEVAFGVQPADGPALADRPDLRRLDREVRIMEKHWRLLEEACDPNAVFALMYLTTTYGIRRNIQNGLFADNDCLS